MYKKLALCVTTAFLTFASYAEEINDQDIDPIEGFNRIIFEFNDIIDGLIFTPFSKMYRGVMHDEVRDRVSFVLRNLREPINFANNLLQGEFEESGVTLGRFLTNSTLGVVGIFDVGTDWGMPYDKQDFGMTLASWGAGEGGYFVIPILGPSTFRDAPAEVVDIAFDPATWVLPASYGYAKSAAVGADKHQEVVTLLEDLRQNSVDYYVALRSWYLEHRRAQIAGEELTMESPRPDDDEDN